MAFVDWIHSMPPQPTVFATIKTNSWQFNAETSSNASLSVLANSTLILMCTATFPVVWFNEDEAIHQNRTYNPFIEEKRQYDVNKRNYTAVDQFSIPAIERYEAVITRTKVSSTEVVRCSSAQMSSQLKPPLTTRIQLSVHTVQSDQHHPQILQAGFDFVRLSPSRSFRYWETRMEIPIIYSHSPTAPLNISVDTPDLRTLYQSAHRETPLNKADITIETKPISRGISQATVIVHRASYYHNTDKQFVINGWYEHENETVISHGFYLHLDASEFHVISAERLNPTNFSVFLTGEEYYLFRMYLPESPILERTRLLVEEQVQNGYECYPHLLLSSDAVSKCGVIGFSLFNESTAELQVGVQIISYVSADLQPCVFTVISDLQGGHNATVKSSLVITSFDPRIYGQDWEPRMAVISVDPPLERDQFAYTNETLNIDCMVPRCHSFWISWEKRDGRNGEHGFPPYTEDDGTTAQSGFRSNGAEVTFFDRDKTGRVSRLTLPFLQHNDTAKYSCILFSSSPRNQFMYSNLPAAIDLTVKDPEIPYFLDGKQFYEEDVALAKGDTVHLLCNVTGDPEPNIQWYLGGTQDGTNSTVLQLKTDSNYQAGQPGIYICVASNRFGEDNRTFNVHYPPETSYLPFAIAVPIAIVFLCAMAGLFLWLRRRAVNASFRELAKLLKNPPQPIPIDDTAPLNDQAQFIPYNRKLEIKRDCFTVTSKMLGEGAYGYIFKGELKMDGHSDARLVAVKLPRDAYNLQHFGALVDEMKVMCQIRPHVNVLALAGACTDHIDKKQLFVLTEFCENGSLKDYLTQTRMKFEGFAVNEAGQFVGAPGAVESLLKYAYQAANGMTHLAAERIIHRDLALRNLLLTVNHIVKISDFGMSRQRTSNLYRPTLSKDFPVPLFWMAPEALFRQKYTQKSDVWSFGIVLWEMFSCGRRPYPDHCPDGSFCNWLRQTDENRMAPPNIACEEMYELMRHCWKSDPAARPTFSECKRIIARTLEEKCPSAYQSTLLTLSEAWLSVSPQSSSTSAEDVRFLEDASTNDTDIRVTHSGEREKENPFYSADVSLATDSGTGQIYNSHDNSSQYSMDNSASGGISQRKGEIPYAAPDKWRDSGSSSLTHL